MKKTLKIDEFLFIKDLLKKKNMTPNIPIKTSSFIKITEVNNCKRTKLLTYQQLIEKLIYLLYNMRIDILFVIERLSKYNTDPQKSHLQVAKKVICYFKRISNWDLYTVNNKIEFLPQISYYKGS